MTPTESAPPVQGFEFDARQSGIFYRLGDRMHFVGLFGVGMGAVAGLLGVSGRDAGLCLAALLFALVGVWTARAGSQFRSVARTKGEDIPHLMAAVDDLRKLYSLQYWLFLSALVAGLLLLATTSLH